MHETDYEYRGLMATTWDVLRGDTSRWGDRIAFRDVIMHYGEPALDVGCATGRLLLEYLAEGIDIDGVDLSPEMLDLCQAKAAERGLLPTLYQQAMEKLDLPRRYGTILVPSSSFQLITDPEAARATMRRFFDILLPGGGLAMSHMPLWQEGDPTETDWGTPASESDPRMGRSCGAGRVPGTTRQRNWNTPRTATRSAATAWCWRRSCTTAPRRRAGTVTTNCGRCTMIRASWTCRSPASGAANPPPQQTGLSWWSAHDPSLRPGRPS